MMTIVSLTTAHKHINHSYNVGLLMVERSSFRFDLDHIGPAIDIAIQKCGNEYNIYLNVIQVPVNTRIDSCIQYDSVYSGFPLRPIN
ncbi:unnamed protein product [Medioppia subpectinata]|uniref:Uncharacterized protein n=1 Tax=Medioppia subpectinata TaxID=1979941 RepID=A0A7R9PVN7_9ACAR|nr:unnamed protein product [Medioppia subpectinata]CAG2103037.1 unnamed protein product [Medioppia subpectinata]